MRILTVAAVAALLALSSCGTGKTVKCTGEPVYKHILLRDFRKGRDGIIVNYNIGTTAHCPGTLASLKKELPDDVEFTVWADSKLDPVLEDMMAVRWPDVKIVYGTLDENASDDLKAAVEESDLLLVSSGSSIASSVHKSLKQYKSLTGKATAAYAIGSGTPDVVKDMDFIWYRDEKSLDKAVKAGDQPAICGFAPDAVFDFDCVDDEAAERLLKEKGLLGERFICCIPGNRITPGWEFFGGDPDEKKIAFNAEHADADNGILRRIICECVREKGVKVLICAEQVPEVKLGKEIVYDKLPDDVRSRCACLDTMWSPQLALAVYRRSAAVAGIQMHSPVMAVGNGVPAVILRHPGFGSKSDMWRTIGLGHWLIDIDDEDASDRACEAVLDILDNPDAASRSVAAARAAIDSMRHHAVQASFMAPARR